MSEAGLGLVPAPTKSRYSLKSSGLKAVPRMSTDPESTAPAAGLSTLASGGVRSTRTLTVPGALALPARSTATTE